MNEISSTPLSTSGRVSDLAYDPSSQFLGVITEGDTVAVWHRPYREEEWCLISQWQPGEAAQLVKVAWASPAFGTLLVLASQRGDLTFWRIPRARCIADLSQPTTSAEKICSIVGKRPTTALEFAPKAYGLRLAVGDAAGVRHGHIRYKRTPQQRLRRLYTPSAAHSDRWALDNDIQTDLGEACACITWRPHAAGLPPMLAVGTSKGAAVWLYEAPLLRWVMSKRLPLTSAATSIAWAPTLGRPRELIAVGHGSTVSVFSLTGAADDLQAVPDGELPQAAPVSEVQWNPLGSWLAVSTAAPEVVLWRTDLTGCWRPVSRVKGVPADGMG